MNQADLNKERKATARKHGDKGHVVAMAPGGWFCRTCPTQWTKDGQR